MSSAISHLKNPFQQDYSTSSLLKKNHSHFLKYQPKPNQENSLLEHSHLQHSYIQNLPPSTSICNPYSHSTITPYEPPQFSKEPTNLRTSQARSLSQSRSIFGSLDRNIIYKGLEDMGHKHLMKLQKEKQARYLLKNYGPQSLIYKYAPLEKYSLQKKNPLESKANLKSSKKTDSRVKIDSQRWNNTSTVASEYYGYHEGSKQPTEEDYDFLTLRSKKSSFKEFSSKLPSGKDFSGRLPPSGKEVSARHDSRKDSGKQLSVKQNSGKQLHEDAKSQKYSYYEHIANIPQDRNEDFESGQHIRFSPDVDQDLYRSIEFHTPFRRRISIQNINHNSSHRQSSVSSAFGCSEMYESGGNFITRFGGKSKGGPIDMNAFDDEKYDEKCDEDDFKIDHSIGTIRRDTFAMHPDTLEHNNKIYFRIAL